MGGGIWVVGEVDAAGALTKLSGEAATAARALGEAGGREVIGVLVNATGLTWDAAADGVPAGPRVEMQPFGGRVLTSSGFTGERGIILLRPNMVTAEPLAQPGSVEECTRGEVVDLPLVRVVERVITESPGPSIEGARLIVAGGRGVGHDHP